MVGVDGIEPSDTFSFREKRAATTLYPNKWWRRKCNESGGA
jgi:hypothetical protein